MDQAKKAAHDVDVSILVERMKYYLINLQTGQYGPPSLGELQAAGLLHQWLEREGRDFKEE